MAAPSTPILISDDEVDDLPDLDLDSDDDVPPPSEAFSNPELDPGVEFEDPDEPDDSTYNEISHEILAHRVWSVVTNFMLFMIFLHLVVLPIICPRTHLIQVLPRTNVLKNGKHSESVNGGCKYFEKYDIPAELRPPEQPNKTHGCKGCGFKRTWRAYDGINHLVPNVM